MKAESSHCQVCYIENIYDPSDPDLKVVRCVQCKKSTHIRCYGLPSNAASFTCDPCKPIKNGQPNCSLSQSKSHVCCFCSNEGLLKKVVRHSDHPNSNQSKSIYYAHPLCALYSTEVRVTSYSELAFELHEGINISQDQLSNQGSFGSPRVSRVSSDKSSACEICKKTSHKINSCVECKRHAHLYCIVMKNYYAKIDKKSSKSNNSEEKKLWSFHSILANINNTYQLFNLLQFLKSKKMPQECWPFLSATVNGNSTVIPLTEDKLPRLVFCDEHTSSDQSGVPTCICNGQVHQSWIWCDRCQYWYHQDCLKSHYPGIQLPKPGNDSFICELCKQWGKVKKQIISGSSKELKITKSVIPGNLQFHQQLFILSTYQQRRDAVDPAIVETLALPKPIPVKRQVMVLHAHLVIQLEEHMVAYQNAQNMNTGQAYLKKYPEIQEILEYMIQNLSNNQGLNVCKASSNNQLLSPPAFGKKSKSRRSKTFNREEMYRLLETLDQKYTEAIKKDQWKAPELHLGIKTQAIIEETRLKISHHNNASSQNLEKAAEKFPLEIKQINHVGSQPNSGSIRNITNSRQTRNMPPAGILIKQQSTDATSFPINYVEAVQSALWKYLKFSKDRNISFEENYTRLVRKVQSIKKSAVFQAFDKPLPEMFGFISEVSCNNHEGYIKAIKFLKKLIEIENIQLPPGEKFSDSVLLSLQKEYMEIPRQVVHLVEDKYDALRRSGLFLNQVHPQSKTNVIRVIWLTPEVETRIKNMRVVSKRQYLHLRNRCQDIGREDLYSRFDADYVMLELTLLQANELLGMYSSSLNFEAHQVFKRILTQWDKLKVKPDEDDYNRVYRYSELCNVVSHIYHSYVKQNYANVAAFEVERTYSFLKGYYEYKAVPPWDIAGLIPKIYEIIRLHKYKNEKEDPMLEEILSIWSQWFLESYIHYDTTGMAYFSTQMLSCEMLQLCFKLLDHFGFTYYGMYVQARINLQRWKACVSRINQIVFKKSSPELRINFGIKTTGDEFRCFDDPKALNNLEEELQTATKQLQTQSFNFREDAETLKTYLLWTKISRKANDQFLQPKTKMTPASLKELRDIARESRFPLCNTLKKINELIDEVQSIDKRLEQCSFRKKKQNYDLAESMSIVANKITVAEANQLVRELKESRFMYDYKIDDIQDQLQRFAQKKKDVENAIKKHSYDELMTFVNYFLNQTPFRYFEFDKLRNALKSAMIQEQIPIKSEKELQQLIGWGGEAVALLKERYADTFQAYERIKKLQKISNILMIASLSGGVSKRDYTNEDELLQLKSQLLPEDNEYREQIDAWLNHYKQYYSIYCQNRMQGRFEDLEVIVQNLKRSVIDSKVIVDEYSSRKHIYNQNIFAISLYNNKITGEEILKAEEIEEIRQTVSVLSSMNAHIRNYSDMNEQIKLFDNCHSYTYSTDTYLEKLQEWKRLKNSFVVNALREKRLIMFKKTMETTDVKTLSLKSTQLLLDEFAIVNKILEMESDSRSVGEFVCVLLSHKTELSKGQKSVADNGVFRSKQDQSQPDADADLVEEEQEEKLSQFNRKRQQQESLKQEKRVMYRQAVKTPEDLEDSQEEEEDDFDDEQFDQDEDSEFMDEYDEDEQSEEERDRVTKKTRGNKGEEIIIDDSEDQ